MFARALALASLCVLAAAPAALAAVSVTCPLAVPEGRPFLLTVESDTPLYKVALRWLGRTYEPAIPADTTIHRVDLVLGMGMRERMAEAKPLLELRYESVGGASRWVRRIERLEKDYPEERLTVDGKFSDLSPEDLARHETERARVEAALAAFDPVRSWELPLKRPVTEDVTSDYGKRRWINDEAKKPHSGVDFGADTGKPAWACADGRVVLAEEHFFAGKSVYVDHGQGLISMYFHLSEILVAAGDAVTRGQAIGLIGETGRVTGAHLHWGVSAFGQLVDPLVLLELGAGP